MERPNLILLTDSYKLSHWRQYPPGTEEVYSYFESRVGAEYGETVFFGLQRLILDYLMEPVTLADILEATALSAAHFGSPALFNREGWEHVLFEHGGRLPLRIRAVPEGMVVPTGNVLMTVENSCPHCYWLTNVMETLLTHVWYTSTVATLSRKVKSNMLGWLVQTGCRNLDAVLPFMLHDFGCRGASSMESAAAGGMAHLVNFRGTDTLPAIRMARRCYDAPFDCGLSVPAAEHSTISSWGPAGEAAAYRNMLDAYPTGIVSVVSDTWDFQAAVEYRWCGTLADKVQARSGRLVIRPDSGDPIAVNLAAIRTLADRFGFDENATGHRVLPNYVRLIQGDGMEPESISQLLMAAGRLGWAAENWVFGMGGGLLQKVNRDQQRFAFKCSSAVVKGERRDVFKRPATDPSKDSKRGQLALVEVDEQGTLSTVPYEPGLHDQLRTVYENGNLLKRYGWEEVVARAAL